MENIYEVYRKEVKNGYIYIVKSKRHLNHSSDFEEIIFNFGMDEYVFSKFFMKEWNGVLNYIYSDIKYKYFFFSKCYVEMFCEYLNTYTYHFNKSLHNKKSFEDNNIFFQDFYDSYKVMAKLCDEIEDDWMKWL